MKVVFEVTCNRPLLGKRKSFLRVGANGPEKHKVDAILIGRGELFDHLPGLKFPFDIRMGYLWID